MYLVQGRGLTLTSDPALYASTSCGGGGGVHVTSQAEGYWWRLHARGEASYVRQGNPLQSHPFFKDVCGGGAKDGNHSEKLPLSYGCIFISGPYTPIASGEKFKSSCLLFQMIVVLMWLWVDGLSSLSLSSHAKACLAMVYSNNV